MGLLTSFFLCVCFLAHGSQSSGILAFPYVPEPPEDCHPYNTMVGKYQPWVLDVFYREVLKGGKLNDLIHAFTASQISDRMALTLASNLQAVIDDKKNGIIYNVYIRPASCKSDADLQKVEYKPLNGNNKLMILYTEKPLCAGNVCLPKLNKRYDWDQCFVVGKQELPTDQQLNKTGQYLTCYIYYKANKSPRESWSDYQYNPGDIHFPGVKDLGSCVVNLGSPVMCATGNKPDHYIQAGIVDKRNVDYMQKTCGIDEAQEDILRDECKRNNLQKVATYCKNKPERALITYCYGFTAFYIDSNLIKTATKDRSPKSWKPTCGRGALKAQYNEFPWILAIFNSALKGDYLRDRFLCAASLIHPHMAISSAQCKNRAGLPMDNYIISGIRSLDDVNEYNEIDERDRRRGLSFWDNVGASGFSILFWKDKLNVDPIPFWKQQGSLTKCLTLGWGFFNKDIVLYQATLKKAEMPIHNEIDCLNRFKYDYPETELGHISGYICAGGGHPSDICIADQGGPLICKLDDGSAALVGVLEHSLGCPYGLGSDFALNEVYAPNLYLNIDEKWREIQTKMGEFKPYIP